MSVDNDNNVSFINNNVCRRVTEATTLEVAEYPMMEVEQVSEELIKRVIVSIW